MKRFVLWFLLWFLRVLRVLRGSQSPLDHMVGVDADGYADVIVHSLVAQTATTTIVANKSVHRSY